jgi:hypothetical protein
MKKQHIWELKNFYLEIALLPLLKTCIKEKTILQKKFTSGLYGTVSIVKNSLEEHDLHEYHILGSGKEVIACITYDASDDQIDICLEALDREKDLKDRYDSFWYVFHGVCC